MVTVTKNLSTFWVINPLYRLRNILGILSISRILVISQCAYRALEDMCIHVKDRYRALALTNMNGQARQIRPKEEEKKKKEKDVTCAVKL